jgi:hypothetical protein
MPERGRAASGERATLRHLAYRQVRPTIVAGDVRRRRDRRHDRAARLNQKEEYWMNKTLGMLIVVSSFALGGCVGTIIDATTDAAIEVVKIPFKIGGAAVDMMRGTDPDDVGSSARARDKEAAKDAPEKAPPTP